MSLSDSDNRREKPNIILRVWKGDFGSPTMHPQSLQVLTYMKINNIDFRLQESTFPFFKPIPSLTVDDEIFTNTMAIWDQLSELKPYNTDRSYGPLEQSRIQAYVNYVIESIETALIINIWIEEKNYNTITNMWFRKAMYFPFNRMHLKKIKSGMEKHVEFLARDVPIKEYKKFEYTRAKRCISDLSTLLGNKKFFFGETATTLDAYVYGYLCILIKVPFPDSTLANYIKSHHNLVRHVHVMTATFFPGIKDESKYIHINPSAATPLEEEEAPTRVIVAAGFLAFASMLAYAVMIGQFKIQK